MGEKTAAQKREKKITKAKIGEGKEQMPTITISKTKKAIMREKVEAT